MAKKTTATTAVATKKAPAIAVDADVQTPVKETKARNSVVPPAAKTKAPAAVAEHAYHLWINGTPGDHVEHWTTAERALRGK